MADQLTSITHRPVERIMGETTSHSQVVTYVERGSGLITNGIAVTYIPTRLKSVFDVSLVGMDAYAKVALFTTVAGWISDLTTNLRSNTAQAGGTTTTIKLDASASATDDIYNNLWIEITDVSTGVKETRKITDYDGTTKIATLNEALSFAPGATTLFTVLALTITHTDPGHADGAEITWSLTGKY